MTSIEIKNKIDCNLRLIEELTDPFHFVLNKKVENLIKENNELRKLCSHNYKDGICIYCYSKESVD